MATSRPKPNDSSTPGHGWANKSSSDECEIPSSCIHARGRDNDASSRPDLTAPSSYNTTVGEMPSADITSHDLYKELVNLAIENRPLAKDVARAALRHIAPKPVPMSDVLATDGVKRAGEFHDVARKQGKEPQKTYQDLRELVAFVGLNDWQVIYFSEEEWIKPSPNSKIQPGKNRNALSGGVLKNIIKHLQRSCAGRCGKSFEDYLADELSGIHLDHRDPRTKGTKYRSPCDYSFENAEGAFDEWIKCEATCADCHDLSEFAAGRLRVGGKKKRSGAERIENGSEKNKKQKLN